jgi:hypothetical protein
MCASALPHTRALQLQLRLAVGGVLSVTAAIYANVLDGGTALPDQAFAPSTCPAWIPCRAGFFAYQRVLLMSTHKKSRLRSHHPAMIFNVMVIAVQAMVITSPLRIGLWRRFQMLVLP